MDSDVQRNLAEAVRRWARPTTAEELKQRGTRLRSIDLNQLEVLIERAVGATLAARLGQDAPAEELDRLGREASDEFRRLLADAPNASSTGRSIDTLRGEVRARQRAAEARERELALEALRQAAPAHEEFESDCARLFAAQGAGELDPGQLEEAVVTLAREVLERDRLRTLDHALAGHREEIDRLERRLRKVTDLLARTEGDLKKLISRGNQDPGVASIYDSVQGLDLEDEQYAQKGVLLSALFDANLALRQRMAGDGPA